MGTFPIFHNLIGHPIVQWRGLHAAGISEGSVKPLGQTKDHKLCIDYQKTSESGQYFKKVKVWTFEEPLALHLGSVGLASWEIRGSADLRKTLNLAGCKKRTRRLKTKLSASQQNEEKAWRWNQAVEINEESYKIELFNDMKASLRANPYLWSHPLTFRIWMQHTL